MGRKTLSESAPSPSARIRWLCVAYAFPPMARSGTHRTLAFVRHLHQAGWEADVLTAVADADREPCDPSLSARVPESTRVIRVPWSHPVEQLKRIIPTWLSALPRVPRFPRQAAMSASAREAVREISAKVRHEFPKAQAPSFNDWFTRFLTTPDSRSSWIVPAVRAGWRCIMESRPRLIYSTSPYASAHLAALVLASRFRLPWVADFRDPWRGNPFHDARYRGIECWDDLLERVVMRRATRVIFNTSPACEQARRRRPFLKSKCHVIANGFDEEVIAGATPRRPGDPERFVLTHAGQFYGPRSPIPWLEALRMALQRWPANLPRPKIAWIGSDHYNDRKLGDLARHFGVADDVRLHGPLSHEETLGMIAGSDALLLAGAGGEGGELQVPAKIYEYLALRRPIVACVSEGSPVRAILAEAAADAVVCPPGEPARIAEAFVTLADPRRKRPSNAWAGVHRFSRTLPARRLTELFEALTMAPALKRAHRGFLPEELEPHPMPMVQQLMPSRLSKVGSLGGARQEPDRVAAWLPQAPSIGTRKDG